MELIDGETLREWIRHPWPLARLLEVARQVLEALSAAHLAGVIHRDLKPDNVMVRADGYAKVLDFGLAKWLPANPLLETDATMEGSLPGQILGTVAYMSPEQIQGQEVDARSDLFAFGILLYELLTGRHPWPRPTVVDRLHAILHDDPPPLDASPPAGAALEAVVQTLLRKHPAARYSSAGAALEALANLAATPAPSGQGEAGPAVLTSIAVLPFVVLGEADDSRALSLGFADALITIFGNLADLAVAPTSAILNYAAGTEPARVCLELGVRHTLQATVQRLGNHWRVSIQLFDASSRKLTFSEKHDFTLDNVFDVQDEIGRLVAQSLDSRFPRAPTPSRDRYSSDPEAYNDFMAGLRESAADQPDGLRIAAAHLSSAVTRDPDCALADAALSFVSMNIHFSFESQRVWLQQAETHCRLALTLDPTLPEGHLARAWILWSPAKGFQHAEAIAALGQVLAARPNLERAHNRMATICLHIGRLEEGRRAHEQSMRSNPRTRTGNLEYFYIYSGDVARAEAAVEAWYRERMQHALLAQDHGLVRQVCRRRREAVFGEREVFAHQRGENARRERIHVARAPGAARPIWRCSMCAAHSIRRARSATRTTPTTRSPVCTRSSETRTWRWTGSNAASAAGFPAGRSSVSIPISGTCAGSHPSSAWSPTSSTLTPP